jgi:outer membrane protein assembly factor BamB
MCPPTRRQILGAVGAGALGTAGGGYLVQRRIGPGCPEYREPSAVYDTSLFNIWSRAVQYDEMVLTGEGAGITKIASGPHHFRLLALDDGGDPVWIARETLHGGIGRPAPTDDRVFVATGGNELLAYDRETGNREWRFDAGQNYSGGMGVVSVVEEDTVVAAVTNPDPSLFDGESQHYLVGVSAAGGTVQWTVGLPDEVSRGLVGVDGMAVTATVSGDVFGIDPETGNEQWRQTLDGEVGTFSTPERLGDHVWIARRDGTIVILHAGTGERINRVVTGATPADTKTIESLVRAVEVGDDVAVVGDAGRSVTAYEGNGSERWQYESEATPAALDIFAGRVVVVDQRAVYTELDIETGEQYRSFSLTDRQRDGRCGLRGERDYLIEASATERRLVLSGRALGVRVYILPPRESS